MTYTDMQVATEFADAILTIARELGHVEYGDDDDAPANEFDYAHTVTETRDMIAEHLLAWVTQYREALNSLQCATGETWYSLGEDLELGNYSGNTLYDRYNSDLIPDSPLDDTFPECSVNLWVDNNKLHAELDTVWYSA